MPVSSPDTIQIIAAVLFGTALIHTFAAKQFERLSHRMPAHAGLFHLLGEVEVVFGFWAIALVVTMALLAGPADELAYAESRQYTEPLFVFVVMVIVASRPIFQAVTVGTRSGRRHDALDARAPAGRCDPPGVLAGVVVLAHHPVAFLGLFLLFLGYTQAYERHQNPLIVKEALLVAFFLAGLVVLGGSSSGGCSPSWPVCRRRPCSSAPWA